MAAVLVLAVTVSIPVVQSDTVPLVSPLADFLPANLGAVKQFYSPSDADMGYVRPDFILIENVHCNRSVQLAISEILRRLKVRELLPRQIAVEGAVGSVDLDGFSKYPNPNLRRAMADRFVSRGEMQGVVHFVFSEGQGNLYGIENEGLYQASLDMFRRSYPARVQLTRELDELLTRLDRIKESPDISARVSILTQDAVMLRRLVCQRLEPEGIYRSISQAVYAIDHL